MGQNNKRTSVKSIVLNDVKIESNSVIADAFNDYFATVAEKLESQMPVADGISPCSFMPNQLNSFYLHPVTQDECIDVISRLKNTGSGMNYISVKLIKNVK